METISKNVTMPELAPPEFNYAVYQLPTLVAVVLVLIASIFLRRDGAVSLPIANPKKMFELTSSRPIFEFAMAGRETLASAREKFGPKPFRVHTDMGTFIILRPEHGDEIRSDPRFSVDEPIIELFQAKYRGFEPFMEGALPTKPLQNVVKLKITKSLAKVTKPLSEECAAALQAFVGEPQGWHDVVLMDLITRLISKMSARIFAGPTLSKNERWIDLVVNYGDNSIQGMRKLRLWPSFLKPFAVNFIPECKNLQAQVKEAWDLVAGEIEARRAKNDGTEYNDAVHWFEELAGGDRYNFGASQLMLAVVSIGTTSDLIAQTLVDILRHPELIQPLREEIIACISEGGWQKTSLYNMKLLDSVLNESQRLKPNQIASMFRQALETVTLSDGTKVPKGHKVAVSTERMRDPAFYENPETFDGYRFLRMRDTSQAAASQLVTTSVNHLGFGHGEHGCPGRFFAASEAKIVISHILLKYDLQLDSNVQPQLRKFGFAEEADPKLKISMKRRKEEIPL
ncbi:trichothecene c-8 hydroxylase cytochrome p450 monooxygenase [Colletotrichum karsti]|uniref:Trichothecene c-8 hydroxylase cytochrome p450 monooxygenase n=1 Tax=Colletotrichum karsti TaxID=1095194 RepID=A0A9P6IGW5_9PEZI|nr:trichothecene c-8 hydroxylase cytochrome p450 monooxygenase [Colletotrichum karsti]KAF9878635.1 trichothecene c-8 hydroxylase cytochrome p450 monooxygenase [Colletotrichum karsti]